jgi:hypothetical protein
MQQANGLIIAIHAIDQEEKSADRDKPVNIEDCICSYVDELSKHHPSPSEIQEKLTRKRSKYHREKPTTDEGQRIYRIRRCEK